ncbi:MAG TPA: type II toxin-antitoxin system PemK/MazF family toxin [Pyrinomonadaceae bacterium]|nr:type II toxin-antitoxin system PemK/MazF family toxin [Pyrinomonadaceae bacterium]
MGEFVRGQVVVLPFPFSNLKAKKHRPALVLAEVGGPYNELILCMITAKPSEPAIQIKESDFQSGKLDHLSYVKPERLFTAEARLIKNSAGVLNSSKMKEIMDQIRRLFGFDEEGPGGESNESG